MLGSAFYQQHLDQVSRSFSFCIARLNEPLKSNVGLSYLICRILDTAEDSTWSDQKLKSNCFNTFEEIISQQISESEIEAWANSIPTPEKISEQKLLKDCGKIFSDYYSLHPDTREKIKSAVLCMAKGMKHFSETHPEGMKLRTLAELNLYCFFVAGIVGELLTDLLFDGSPDTEIPPSIYLQSHHFGLFLQKINILKDQAEDQELNRFFIPDMKSFTLSLSQNANQALAYLKAVPNTHKDFRLFCAWSLFLGLASLEWMQKSYMLTLVNKIPRWMTEKLLSKVENIIHDNQALEKLFTEMLEQMPPVAKTAELSSNNIHSHEQNILFNLYQGKLTSQELQQLV